MKKTTEIVNAKVAELSKDKTKVEFLLEKEEHFTNQVFAYFPEEVEGEKVRLCYAHIGQHSVCHIDYAKQCKKARPYQYRELLMELKSIGYNLLVI